MKHLFEDWANIQNRIGQAQKLSLFLDYDGTLTPIVSRPELALCPPEVKLLLEKLRDLPNVDLAIISGRALEDVWEKVGVPGIIYVGNYGLSLRNPIGVHKKKLSNSRQKEFGQIGLEAKESLGKIQGILFEDKGLILAVHYRNVPQEDVNQIQKALQEITEKWKDRWQIHHGKMVFEIQPRVDFNKGKAVQDILKGIPPQGLLPITLGDDSADEDAFRAIGKKGISVYVGEPIETPSEAEFYLKDPREVMEFLRRCEEIMRRKQALPGR